MQTKMNRLNKVQAQESIIYFHAISGMYVKGIVKSTKNYDVEYKGYGQVSTKGFSVEVHSDGRARIEVFMLPFEYKVFKSQDEFETRYKATYQPILYSQAHVF